VIMTRVLIAGHWIDFDLIEQIAEALKQETGDIINVLKSTFDKDHCKGFQKVSSGAMSGLVIGSFGGSKLLESFKDFEERNLYDIILRCPPPIDFPKPPYYQGEDYWWHDPALDSYFPKHGVFCKFLWINPSIIHDQLCVLAGYVRTFFYRKCFMQLKCFVNLRFAR